MVTDRTKEILYRMLVEPSSGAHYNAAYVGGKANYERNQGKDFEKELEAKAEFRVYGGKMEIEFSVNVYHFLKERLTYRPDLQRRFERFAKKPENADLPWIRVSEKWAEHMKGAGIYGEGSPITTNTYNGEDALSQTIQYVYATLPDEDGSLKRGSRTTIVILQVHGGADVRGGYPKSRVFELGDDEGLCIFDNARGSIGCDGEGLHKDQQALPGMDPRDRFHAWDTENAGYRWSPSDGGMREKNLEEYKFTQEDEGQEWTPGKIHILSDHSALCPKCGGKLSAGQWPAG